MTLEGLGYAGDHWIVPEFHDPDRVWESAASMQDQQIAGEQKLSPARKHHSWAFFLHASGLFVIFLSNRCCLVERVTERAADEMFVQLLSTSESADCREMAVNTLLRSP